MIVREEDLLEVYEADVAAQELALRALRAVEEKALAAAADEGCGESTLRRGHRTRRAEEYDVEVHGSKS